MKPDLVRMIRDFANESLAAPEAYEPAVGVLQVLAVYEDADELGGASLASVLLHLGHLKKALGLRKLPHDIETIAWSFQTF